LQRSTTSTRFKSRDDWKHRLALFFVCAQWPVGSDRQVGLELDSIVLDFENLLRQRQVEHLDLEIGNENLRFCLPPLRSMVERGNLCDPGFPCAQFCRKEFPHRFPRSREILLEGRTVASGAGVSMITGAAGMVVAS